jgi:hypothetical protein
LARPNSDTWIRPERLHRHLRDLENVYVPRQHIIFLGHAQNGTVGGLVVMSRAVVDGHITGENVLTKIQDGRLVAESVVLRRIFPHEIMWDDLAIAAFPCANCEEGAE